MQLVFGFDRRSQQDRIADLNEQFELEMRKAKEEFADEQEIQKVADMRAKMAIARRYRSEEKFEQSKLQDMTTELRAFFKKNLPISQAVIPTLMRVAEEYKAAGYASNCPLNVILLNTCQELIDYGEIQDNLERTQTGLGNIVYRRWCDKNIAHNSALLNLHAIMANIPTLAISPFFYNGKIHFTVSMWEAQSEVQPMIRPLFSIDCNRIELEKEEMKIEMQNKISTISTLLSGVARDTYMLMTQGLSPTLPRYIEEHSEITAFLRNPENEEIADFVIREYRTAASLLIGHECHSKLLDEEQMTILGRQAEHASNQLAAHRN